jgi:hypothetical protein
VFARLRIKDNQRAGAGTLGLSGVMYTEARAVKQSARVREHMPAACFIDMKVHRLLANRTLGSQGMKSTSSQKLYEFRHPYQQVPHYASSHQRADDTNTRSPNRWQIFRQESEFLIVRQLCNSPR